MFAEKKLLHNQINRLTDILDRMNTRPKCRGTHQFRPYKPISIEAEVIDSFLVMTEAEEIRQRYYYRNRRGIILLDPNPEDIIFQEVPITGRTIIIMGGDS